MSLERNTHDSYGLRLSTGAMPLLDLALRLLAGRSLDVLGDPLQLRHRVRIRINGAPRVFVNDGVAFALSITEPGIAQGDQEVLRVKRIRRGAVGFAIKNHIVAFCVHHASQKGRQSAQMQKLFWRSALNGTKLFLQDAQGNRTERD